MGFFIKDRIYGDVEVTDSLLIELIQSKPLQRLKQISQLGPPEGFYPIPWFSRYEHSLGVMILLQKLGADLEEQIAGLLHDVSHVAFSHIADWVFGHREKEDFQDQSHMAMMKNDILSEILTRYHFDIERVLDLQKFPLLDRNAPDLCADRIDYALREFKMWAAPEIVDDCVKGLKVVERQIVFTSQKTARLFAEGYLKLHIDHWGSPEHVIRYELFAKALSMALHEKIIRKEDFYGDELSIIEKLKKSSHPQILEILRLSSLKKIPFSWDEEHPQLRLKKKFRYTDPFYLERGKLKRLSEEYSEWREKILEARKVSDRGILVSLNNNI